MIQSRSSNRSMASATTRIMPSGLIQTQAPSAAPHSIGLAAARAKNASATANKKSPVSMPETARMPTRPSSATSSTAAAAHRGSPRRRCAQAASAVRNPRWNSNPSAWLSTFSLSVNRKPRARAMVYRGEVEPETLASPGK